MTAVDVDALDAARAAATTDGEWHVDGTFAVKGNRWLIPTGGPENAALIVAAVNALPALLAEVRRGRALRERLEGLAVELDRVDELFSVADRLRAVVAAGGPS